MNYSVKTIKEQYDTSTLDSLRRVKYRLYRNYFELYRLKLSLVLNIKAIFDLCVSDLIRVYCN